LLVSRQGLGTTLIIGHAEGLVFSPAEMHQDQQELADDSGPLQHASDETRLK
jgi:hypothetical protein